jgi:outer membrane protein assembly factor BamD (BamD/ComL family)
MRREWIRRAGLPALVLAALAGSAGCHTPSSGTPGYAPVARGKEPEKKDKDKEPEKKGDDIESLILRPEGLAVEKGAPSAAYPEEVASRLAKARELFRAQEYAKAENQFAAVADSDHNPPNAIQEATYYKAECLRLQGYYPKAADTYVGLMNKFPGSPYREQCCQHVFDIANQWLDDVRAEMREAKEKKDGKNWLSMPKFMNFERQKPLLDLKGRAIEKLEQVRAYDVNGPLADRSLFLCGVVKMYDENYRDADHYFSQIYQRHPDSPLTPKALELGIQCKHLSTGGSDYDGRKSAEARKMILTALYTPQLGNDKEMRTYLEGQMASINFQQAEKEFKMAEFYRSIGHPGSAYFYYELVRRRYPGTKYARLAEERWNELRAKIESEQGSQAKPAPPAPQPPANPAAPGQPKPLPASIRQ